MDALITSALRDMECRGYQMGKYLVRLINQTSRTYDYYIKEIARN